MRLSGSEFRIFGPGFGTYSRRVLGLQGFRGLGPAVLVLTIVGSRLVFWTQLRLYVKVSATSLGRSGFESGPNFGIQDLVRF